VVFALAIIAVALAIQPIKGPKEERTSEGGGTKNAATSEHSNKSQEPSHPTSAPITSQVSSERSKSSTDHDANDVNIQRNIEIFTGVLAGVGVLQLVVMFLTWLIYRRQAREMRRQRHEMVRQRTELSGTACGDGKPIGDDAGAACRYEGKCRAD